jgi:hypothetical protein
VDNFRVRLSDVLEQSRTAFCENPFQMSASSKKSHSSMTHMGSSPRPTKMIDTPASYEYQHGFAVVADGRRTMAEAMVWDSNRPMRKV